MTQEINSIKKVIQAAKKSTTAKNEPASKNLTNENLIDKSAKKDSLFDLPNDFNLIEDKRQRFYDKTLFPPAEHIKPFIESPFNIEDIAGFNENEDINKFDDISESDELEELEETEETEESGELDDIEDDEDIDELDKIEENSDEIEEVEETEEPEETNEPEGIDGTEETDGTGETEGINEDIEDNTENNGTEEPDNTEEEYIPQTTLDEKGLDNYVTILYNAMANWGTNEDAVYCVVNDRSLTPDDWVNIVYTYDKKYAGKKSLINAIDSDFNGKDRASIMPKIANNLIQAAENGNQEAIGMMAYEIHQGTAGKLGTADEFVESVINNASDDVLADIMDIYPLATGSEITKDIQNDFSGKTERNLLSNLNTAYLNSRGEEYTGWDDGQLCVFETIREGLNLAEYSGPPIIKDIAKIINGVIYTVQGIGEKAGAETDQEAKNGIRDLVKGISNVINGVVGIAKTITDIIFNLLGGGAPAAP